MIGSNQIPAQPGQNPYYQPQGVQPTPMTQPQMQRPAYQPPPQSPQQSAKPAKAEKPKIPMVSFYPHIYLVAFIIHMIGLIVVFIGVFLIGQSCIDLGANEFDPGWFEDLGNHIKLLAIGGIIYSGGTVTRGVAKFYDGQMSMRDRIKF